jgi:hypothetical protein
MASCPTTSAVGGSALSSFLPIHSRANGAPVAPHCYLEPRLRLHVRLARELGQFHDARGDPARLIAREQVGRCSAAGLILEIDIRERLTVLVLHDEAGVVVFFDGPRRRESFIEEKSGRLLPRKASRRLKQG